MHLTSYIKNQVNRDVSNSREILTVQTVGVLKSAFQGRGIIFTRMQRFQEAEVRVYADFEMSQASPLTYVADESGSITFEREPQFRFPCSGIITSTGEGYAIGPSFQLDPVKGQSIVLMFLSPRTAEYNIAVEKSVLAISKEQSQTAVTALRGEVRCLGTISNSSKVARIVLNRNPGPPVEGGGFDEILSELRGGGMMSVTWKPISRTFEELLLAFNPSTVFSDDLYSWGLDRIAKNLGAPDRLEVEKRDDYVIGDGIGVNYTLRLRVDRGLGRHDSDETRLSVT